MSLSPRRDPLAWRDFALRCAVIAGVALGVAALVSLFRLVLLLVLGCVFTELLAEVSTPFARRLPGPRALYVGVAFVVVIGAFVGLVSVFLFPFLAQSEELAREIPRQLTRIERVLDRFDSGSRVGPRSALTGSLPGIAVSGLGTLVEDIPGVLDLLGIAFLSVFVAATPETTAEGFKRLWPAAMRPRVDALLLEAREGLRAWIRAVGLSMAIVGLLTTTGLWILDVPFWLVFGLFAAVMELIPWAGLLLGFAGPLATCLLLGQPRKAAFVFVFGLALQLAMLYGVTPWLMKQRAAVPTSVAIVSILGLGIAAGVLGIVAAVPFATIVLAAARNLPAAPRVLEASP